MKVGFLPLLVPAFMLLSACGDSPSKKGEEGVGDSSDSELAAAQASPGTSNLIAAREKMIQSSKLWLAHFAEAAGWSRQFACSATPEGTASNYVITWTPDKKRAVFAHVDKQGDRCDPSFAYKMIFDFHDRTETVPQLNKKTTTKLKPEVVHSTIEYSDIDTKTIFKQSLSVATTIINMKSSTITAGSELALKFSTGIFGFGAETNAKISFSGSGTNSKTDQTMTTDTVEVTKEVSIPAKSCVKIEVLRSRQQVDVPYVSFVYPEADVTFDGPFTNYAMTLRGKDKKIERYSYTFKSQGRPFLEAIADGFEFNEEPFNWAAVNDVVQRPTREFSSKMGLQKGFQLAKNANYFQQKIAVKGVLRGIGGNRFDILTKVIPASAPECKARRQ